MVPQLLKYSALAGLFLVAVWHSRCISATEFQQEEVVDYTLNWVTCDSLDVGKNLHEVADGCLQYQNISGGAKAIVLANYNGKDEHGLRKYTGTVINLDGSTDKLLMDITSIGPGFPVHSYKVIA